MTGAKDTLIGQNNYGEIVFAALDSGRSIFEFSVYVLIKGAATADGHAYLTRAETCCEASVGGKMFQTSEILPTGFTPSFSSTEYQELENAIVSNGYHCDKCDLFHPEDGTMYVILSGDLFCRGCVPVEKQLIKMTDPSDIYRCNFVSRPSELIEAGFEAVAVINIDRSESMNSEVQAKDRAEAERLARETIAASPALFCGITASNGLIFEVTLYARTNSRLATAI